MVSDSVLLLPSDLTIREITIASGIVVFTLLYRTYSPFRDAVTMCFVNGSTSIVAGFAIFSILGHMSVIANKDIAEIVKPGAPSSLRHSFISSSNQVLDWPSLHIPKLPLVFLSNNYGLSYSSL